MDKRVELILQQLQQLPTLPAVAMRLLQVTGSDQASVADVVRLISSDPALTARILQLVHRANVGAAGDLSTVDRAVVLLGFEAVRSATLAISVFQVFGRPGSTKLGHFSHEDFWKHSIAVGCCMELLAEAVLAAQGIDPSQAFVCGLLHDVGKVALASILPKSFDKVVEAAELLRGSIADLERSVIGLDHMVVGKRLAEQWRFPPLLRDCIWLHGQDPKALPASVECPRMVNLLTLADMLVRQQHMGFSGDFTYPVGKAALLAAAGVPESAVQQAMTQLVPQIESRAAALGLDKVSTAELYQQALSQANRELGQISEQLAAKNRRLSVRAKFFDALAQFQGELRADAPPQLVLEAIGQTAVSILQAGAVAVFSTVGGQDLAELVVVDAEGDEVSASVVDCPRRVVRPMAGVGPVLQAGAELEWLLSGISPRLPGDHRFWICLEAEGACIGGVVWGGVPGEAQRLGNQIQELSAIASGWSLALRTAQIREESRTLSEQLAEANRQLSSAQGELVRKRSVASVGEMAAGAAHEMNNPLAVISGRAQLLLSQLSDPKLKHAAQTVSEQAQRLSQIISDLMDFAKPQPPQLAPADLAELVDRALHQAKTLVDPADRQIEVTMSDVPAVQVDAEQVCAALTEILDNALGATNEKEGRITVHGAFDSYSRRVALNISDNGCGMDEPTLKRAFDPFFSSKPAGRRRGLGLAKALRWVESSGGSIRLESRPGAGTQVIVLLPAAASAAAEADEQARKAE